MAFIVGLIAYCYAQKTYLSSHRRPILIRRAALQVLEGAAEVLGILVAEEVGYFGDVLVGGCQERFRRVIRRYGHQQFADVSVSAGRNL